MRRTGVVTIATVVLMFLGATVYAAAPNWRIDPVHSGVYFGVQHIYSTVRGFFAEYDGKTAQMGDSIPLTGNISLIVSSPGQSAEIRFLRNGEIVKSIEAENAKFNVEESGAYRIEVYFYKKAWIYSNHIRIGL